MKNSIFTKASALLITILCWSAGSQAGPEDIKTVLSCKANFLSIRSMDFYKNWATDQMFILINNSHDKFFIQESDFKDGSIPLGSILNQALILQKESAGLADSGWKIVAQGNQGYSVYPLGCQ